MKHLYYTILFFGITLIASGQDLGGTPVEGLIPVKRINSTTENTIDVRNKTIGTSATVKTAAVNTTPTPTGNSQEVGITEGQLSVSLSGAASYAIPIAVPPGISGVVPQVSLVYNSQGGNGMAGYGWNISGVSAITRIPRTKFHDGVVSGVNLDVNDRFALDGQRLILKSGTVYGAAGTVYETESFSNIKITAIGVSPLGANYGPASFKVEYPDGSIAQYGATTDSRSITTWGITYWENPQGVRISYNYVLANNNLSIEYIKYGSTGSNSPINQIQFVYVARQRSEQFYIAGQSILMNTILKEIKTIGNGVGFRNYVLEPVQTYGGYEKLLSITEKSGDNTKSYNPTVFSYETTSDSISYADITTSLSVGNITSSNAGTVSGDFDGDEKMELLIYPATGPSSKAKYWFFTDIASGNYTNIAYEHNVGAFETIFPVSWLTWNNKLWTKQGWAVAKKTDTNYTFSVYCAGTTNPIYLQYERVVNFPTMSHNGIEKISPKKILSGDFNGDGLTDVVAIDLPVSWSCGNGCFVTKFSDNVYFIDLKRDNTTNFLTYSGKLRYITTNTKVEVADVNGDGKSDFMVFENGKVTTYTLDSNNQLVLLWDYLDANISIDSSKTILLGDYNGDGKTDFIIPKGYGFSEWYKYSSTGSNFVKVMQNNRITYIQNSTSSTNNYIVADCNKDGKSDLIRTYTYLYQAKGYIEVNYYPNINQDFSPDFRYSATSLSSTDIKLNAQPFYLPTGRGIITSGKPYNPTLEIAFLSNNKIFYFNSEKDFSKEKLLKTITTGNGVRESITYKPLSPDSLSEDGYTPIYTPSLFTESYPNTDIGSAATVQVVTKLEKQSASIYKKQLFAYAGATSNLEGLGYLGFRASMRTNWFEDQSQIISSISKLDPNLRGANVANYTYLGLYSPTIAINATAPNIPITSTITIKDTRTTSQTVQATNSIRFLPGATISPTAGNTFVAQITPDYDANGYAETNTAPPYNLISKTLSFYEASLSPTKVYNLKNTQSNTYNVLENTSSETATVYDNFNNPTESISIIRNGGIAEQTTTSTVDYKEVSSPYMVGRPASKTQTVSRSGDSMTSKETYEYGSGSESNLLKTIQKWGHNTSSITENNRYDTFGNITKKTISAAGIADRVTNYIYDPAGRFLEESYDIETLKTSYAYNLDGTLKSETNPYGLTTSYLYDSWFKKTTTTDYLGKTNTLVYSRQNEKTLITSTGGDDGTYSEELFDDLGRKIRSGIRDLQNNMSYKDYKYDIYDRNYSTSEPYNGTASLWNTTTYDVYGRPKTVTDFKSKVMSMEHDKLTTTITDGSTFTTKKTTKNAMGNVVQMEETPGGIIKYSYFANGNLKETDYAGTKITLTQDGWGRKTSLTDPSAGNYSYEYNALGEMTKETTPNGTTTYKLDDWGKPDLKSIVGLNTDSNTKYHYYPDSKLLQKTEYTDAKDASNRIITEYSYDDKKRLEKTIETNGYGAVFTKTLTYDAWGRVATETSKAALNGKSSEKVIQNDYKNGFAYKITDKQNPKTLWETKEINARGQLTKATLGNGIAIVNTYDTSGFGYLNNTKHTLTPTTATVMELTNDFHPQRGNLNWRKNSLFGNIQENFTYDSQDRLLSYPDASGAVVSQAYKEDGRIETNVLGTYNYTNTAKKYQNTSVTLTPDALTYYKNRGIAALPSPTATRALNITYNTFKSPVDITEDGVDKLSFVYNDDNSRSVMFYGGLQDNKLDRSNRKYYSADGSMEIKITPAGTEFVTYLGGDGYSAPVVYKKTYSTAGNAQEQMLYLHRDYQGSILAITNEVGAVVEKRQFDAWGSLLLIQNGSSQPIANGQWLLDRGYTGHEHLQSVGLIHMNGRLYDPKLHRFLQPDNLVQDPTNTQNFNRYGYVLNNPLKYTDPSGEFSINLNDIIAGVAIVAGVVLTVVSGGTLAPVGYGLIGAGLAHFGAAYAEYTRTGDWNAASNNAGFSFGYSQRVDWFDGTSNKSDVNGVTLNAPVVTPKTVDDVKKDKGEDSFSNMVSNTYGANDVYNFFGNKIMINSENGSNNWSFLGVIHTSKRFYDGYKRDGINSYSGLLLMHEYGHWLHSQYNSLNWYSYGMWSSMASANSANASSNWTEIKSNTMAYYYFGFPAIFNHPKYKEYYPIDKNSISDELKYKLYHHLKP